MKLEISSNGSWVDITSYLEYQGLSFSRNDLDAPDSGRTLDGIMHRNRVASKERMDCNTIPLNMSRLNNLLTLLYPETFDIRVTPYPGTTTSKVLTVYSNSIKINHVLQLANGEDLQRVSFPLIEV